MLQEKAQDKLGGYDDQRINIRKSIVYVYYRSNIYRDIVTLVGLIREYVEGKI